MLKLGFNVETKFILPQDRPMRSGVDGLYGGGMLIEIDDGVREEYCERPGATGKDPRTLCIMAGLQVSEARIENRKFF